MRYYQGCMICGEDLVYTEGYSECECSICGKSFSSNVKCQKGHYVCDSCHSADALDIIENYCVRCTENNPLEISIKLMDNPHIYLHGPEHHYLIPAALITAYCNQFETQNQKIEKLKIAKERASIVPGGFCGFYGSCGAGIGSGIFASVISEATPLTTDSWGFANKMTGYVLTELGEIGGPRCCKRNGWYSIIKASEFLDREMNKKLFDYENERPVCTYKNKNKECIKINCPFFLIKDLKML